MEQIGLRRALTLGEISAILALWLLSMRSNETRHRRTLKRLEGLVEDVRKALAGSRNASEKVAWLKEMLAAQGYRVDGH